MISLHDVNAAVAAFAEREGIREARRARREAEEAAVAVAGARELASSMRALLDRFAAATETEESARAWDRQRGFVLEDAAHAFALDAASDIFPPSLRAELTQASDALPSGGQLSALGVRRQRARR